MRRSPFRGWKWNWWKPSEDTVCFCGAVWHFAGLVCFIMTLVDKHAGGWHSPWWLSTIVGVFGLPVVTFLIGLVLWDTSNYLIHDFRPSMPRIPPPFVRDSDD